MTKIKSFADACKALKLKSSDLPDVSMLPMKHRKAITSHYMLVIITEALNEGWKPNWKNTNEYKYWPWFKMSPGFGFSDAAYDGWGAATSVGSRLCFKSRELAEYAAKTFKTLYKDYFTYNK